jgi:hypothetical protein
MSTGTISQFIEASKVIIENARQVPEVTAVLAGYGYDDARLAVGARLWADAESLVRRQAKEYGEQHQAGADTEKARTQAESAYMKALKVARVAFSEDAMASAALKLNGPRKQSLSGWMDQAATFYSNLGEGSTLAQGLLRFGYTAQKLQAEAALIEELRSKLQAQARETGEAQAATVERDAKLRELDSWVSELRAIARVAFYESPQELEKLGLLVLNAPRRKKAAGATPATS